MSEEQPRLPINLPEPVARKRRRRGVLRAVRSRRSEQARTLMQVPVLQQCGICGRRQTVLGEAVVCAHCGSLILRDDGEEQ